MKSYRYKSNYDKYPSVREPDIYTSYCYLGWKNILNVLNQRLEAIDKSC